MNNPISSSIRTSRANRINWKALPTMTISPRPILWARTWSSEGSGRGPDFDSGQEVDLQSSWSSRWHFS